MGSLRVPLERYEGPQAPPPLLQQGYTLHFPLLVFVYHRCHRRYLYDVDDVYLLRHSSLGERIDLY